MISIQFFNNGWFQAFYTVTEILDIDNADNWGKKLTVSRQLWAFWVWKTWLTIHRD